MYTKQITSKNQIRWQCVKRNNHCKGVISTTLGEMSPLQMMAKWPLAKCPLVKCPLAKCHLAKCPGFPSDTSKWTVLMEESPSLNTVPSFRALVLVP